MKKRGINSISCFQFPFPNKSEKLNSITEMNSSDIFNKVSLPCKLCWSYDRYFISINCQMVIQDIQIDKSNVLFQAHENDLHNLLNLCSELL